MDSILMLAQAPPVDMSAVQVQSIWDFVLKGGPMMIPIGLCSLIVLTVVAERFLVLRRRNVIPPRFLDELNTTLKDGKEKALAHCENNSSPMATVCAAGIRRLGQPIEIIEKHIVDAGEREVFKLRRFLRVLSVIASVAPLMGLVGTIFGMIKAFQTVAVSGEALGKTELLAQGIYEAMITTAAGLLVAIPALIFYHWISSKVERLVADMDRASFDLLEQFSISRDGHELVVHRDTEAITETKPGSVPATA